MNASDKLNFNTGTWIPGNHPPQATIIMAGDWAPIRAFAPMIEQDPKAVYGDLLPLLKAADLSVVNLEAPLSDTGEAVCKSGAVFKGRTCHVKGLTAVPFDGVTLGNNHMFDFGVAAFRETVQTLEARGIRHTGAGMDLAEAQAPMILEANGLSVAVVNVSEGEDLTAAGKGPGVVGWDIPRLAATIRAARQTADVVIAVAHCGLEYIPFAPPYAVQAFKQMAEAGADAVIAHHPHVPQGVFFHQGEVPICCSLGNFLFYQPTDLYWRKLGYMAELGAVRTGHCGAENHPLPDPGPGALPSGTRPSCRISQTPGRDLPSPGNRPGR